VGLDEVGLLVGLGLLLGLAKLLDETHGAALQTTVDPAAGTSVDNIAELVGGEVEEPVEREVTSAWGCSLWQQSSQFHLPSSRRIVRGGSNVLVKVDSSVGELSERSLSLELGSLLGVLLNQRTHVSRVLYMYFLSLIVPSSSRVGGGREFRRGATVRAAGVVFCFQRGGTSRGHTYVFVSHYRGVVLIEFAGRRSEYDCGCPRCEKWLQ
jgi:hypothetical protein